MPTFTRDVSGAFRRNMTALFAGQPRRPWRYLEVGVHEGGSGVWAITQYLTHPQATYTGVDAYVANRHAARAVALARKNLNETRKNVELIVGDSRVVLGQLIRAAREFDIIYIDGDHTGLGVATDFVLAWAILAEGGYIGFDDMRHPKFRSLGPAVRAVQALVPHKVCLDNDQLWLQKVAN